MKTEPKTQPTDIDREAAGIFSPARGMRAVMADPAFGDGWVTICRITEGGTVCGWRENSKDGLPDTWEAWGPLASIRAIDTDDPATTGVMEAAIIAALGGMPDIWGVHYHCDGGWVAELNDSHYYGATKGAALVAAMRALKPR